MSLYGKFGFRNDQPLFLLQPNLLFLPFVYVAASFCVKLDATFAEEVCGFVKKTRFEESQFVSKLQYHYKGRLCMSLPFLDMVLIGSSLKSLWFRRHACGPSTISVSYLS